MEETVKKRGRKKKEALQVVPVEIEETVKKLLDEVSDKILVAAFGMDEKDVRNIMKNNFLQTKKLFY